MTMLSVYATDRRDAGSYANQVLYRLCEEHPNHVDAGIVAAKIGLIGRYYSASPKRGVGSKVGDPAADFFNELAQHLCSYGGELDVQLKAVRQLGRIATDIVSRVSDTHSWFDQLVVQFINGDWLGHTATRRVHQRASFSSKYLHFHAPDAFPIYDSVVIRNANLSCRSYVEFCSAIVAYGDRKFGEGKWTPRLLDRKLYPYEAI